MYLMFSSWSQSSTCISGFGFLVKWSRVRVSCLEMQLPGLESRVEDPGFGYRVPGSGFRAPGLVFGVWCLVFGVRGSMFGFWCLVFGVWCLVFWCFGIRVLGLGSRRRVSGSGFWILVSELRVWCLVCGVWNVVFGD